MMECVPMCRIYIINGLGFAVAAAAALVVVMGDFHEMLWIDLVMGR